jgi:predicted permease
VAGLTEDLKSATRQVRKNPRLLLLIAVILGVGIATNATIFSLIDAAARLPIQDQFTVNLLWSVNSQRGLDRTPVSAGDFADLKARLKSVKAIAAFSEDTVHLTGGTEPVRMPVQHVTANYFSVLGVVPAIGRDFNIDDLSAAEPAVILSDSTWQKQFGSDPNILERKIQINGVSHRIAGVMKPKFQYLLPDVALWIPMKDPTPAADRVSHDLIVVGRLFKAGDAPRLNAEATVIAQQLASEHPGTDAGWQFSTTPAIPVRPQERVVLALIIGLPVVMLGIACANIANILLARGIGRNREIAVRIAIGASRWRIIRLLLIESSVYALVGGAAGILGSLWGISAVKQSNFLWADARLDPFVLLVSVAMALACGIVSGLTPALHTTRLGVAECLRRGSGKATIDRKGQRLRSVLVIGEIAAATVLLLLAAFGIRSVEELRAIPTGFRLVGVQTFGTEILDYRYPAMSDVVQAHEAVLQSLRRLPNVRYAGAGERVPTQGGRNNPTRQIEIDGRSYPDPRQRDWGMDLAVTPGYFEALGVPLLRGRYFDQTDSAAAPRAAIISQTMAKKYWQDDDPVGQTFHLAGDNSSPPTTIVGVVGDVRNDAADQPPAPMLYFPLTQRPKRPLTYVLQSFNLSVPDSSLIRSAVAAADPTLPIFDVHTMSELLNEDLSGTYFTAGFLSVLGIIALALAAIGIFGVLSQITSERRTEIGIRVALGANPGQVVLGFVMKAIRLSGVGIGIGVVLTLCSFRLIRGTLYGVGPADPIALGFTLAALFATAMAACYLPARSAARIDPMATLRNE